MTPQCLTSTRCLREMLLKHSVPTITFILNLLNSFYVCLRFIGILSILGYNALLLNKHKRNAEGEETKAKQFF